MAVKKDERMVRSKKNKDKMVKKVTYKCEGSYVDLNGISHRYHKRGFSTAEEAKEWEHTFLLKAKTEIDNDLTFYDLYVLYINSKKDVLKERSYYEITKTFEKHILPYWKELKIKSISLRTIEMFQTNLLKEEQSNGEHYSNATLKKIQVYLKAVFKYGDKYGYTKDYRLHLFENVMFKDQHKKEINFWQPSEFNEFIKVVDEHIYVALFDVLYWCGLRIGEALALKWSDIDMDKKTIIVNKSYTKHTHQFTPPKTQNSYRTVIMPNHCFNAVLDLYQNQKKIIGFDNNKLLFYFDKPLNENSIRIKKDRWIKEAGVKRIRIHDLRHSHVSLLISLGFNPFDISKRLGHTVEMVNNVYGHWFQDAQSKMVDKLNTL